jgi:hypothetical protein
MKLRNWKRTTRHRVRRGVFIFAALLIFEYLVIPRLVAASQHLSLLKHINIWWLLVGIALEGLALLCYALLSRTVLPRNAPNLNTIFRIDLATTAVAHVVPGGTAGSAGLGYRLFTSYGMSGTEVGFAMATQGMGSAVVLNIMLWLALIISIPLAGVHRIYIIVALVGTLAILAVAALVFAFTTGEESAARVVRSIARRIPRLNEQRFEEVVRQISSLLRDLGKDPQQLKEAILWAALNWLLDAASLAAFLAALHQYVDPFELFAAYGIANVLAVIPITPAGIGVVEASCIGLLQTFGVHYSVATLAVLGWRFVNFWLPIPVGAGCYISLRVQRGAGLKERRAALSNLPEEAKPLEEI